MLTTWLVLVLCHGTYLLTSASRQDNYITREDVESILRNVEFKYTTALTSMKREIDELKKDKVRLENDVQRLLVTNQAPVKNSTDTNPPKVDEINTGDLGWKYKYVGDQIEMDKTGSKRYLLGDTLQSVAGSVGVAFSVTLSTDGISNIRPNQAVHFDKVISNLGNGYDVSAATFRVPVSGWYAFSLTLMSRPNEKQKLLVVKNGAEVFHCYVQGDEFNTASRTVAIHASRGENVWVQTASETTFSTTVHGYEQTSFTGFVLYAD